MPHLPDHRVAIEKNVHARLLVVIDLVAADRTLPVAQDNNAGTHATVYSVTLRERKVRIASRKAGQGAPRLLQQAWRSLGTAYLQSAFLTETMGE